MKRIRLETVDRQVYSTHSPTKTGVRNALRNNKIKPSYVYLVPRWDDKILLWELLEKLMEHDDLSEENFNDRYEQEEDAYLPAFSHRKIA